MWNNTLKLKPVKISESEKELWRHEGVFTDVNIEMKDDTTGKRRVAHMDADDAAEILATAAKKAKFAEMKVKLQAEWKKIEEAERQAG